jgi:hypothetical protein
MREICTSGSVRGEGGNILTYSAQSFPARTQSATLAASANGKMAGSRLVRDDGFAACDLPMPFSFLQETCPYSGGGRGFGKLPEMCRLSLVKPNPLSRRQPFNFHPITSASNLGRAAGRTGREVTLSGRGPQESLFGNRRSSSRVPHQRRELLGGPSSWDQGAECRTGEINTATVH